MYRILPFIAAIESALPVNIPVEIWAIILRNLDPESLLSTIRAEPHLKRVANGDPILREKIRSHLERQKERRRQEMLNPGLLYTVTRSGPSTLFGVNQKKTVHVHQPTRVEKPEDYLGKSYEQRKTGKAPKKTKKTSQNIPLRKSMRC